MAEYMVKIKVEIIDNDNRSFIIEEPADKCSKSFPPDRYAAWYVTCTKTGGRADINYLATAFSELVDFRDGKIPHVRKPGQGWCPIQVEKFHLPEIWGSVWGFGDTLPNKPFTTKCQLRVGRFFIS